MRTLLLLFLPSFGIATAQEPTDETAFPREWFWHETEAQWERHAALMGEPMPELHLSHWQNAELDVPADLRGKIVVVDFWATWCKPCLAAVPENNELWRATRDDGVVLLGVCGSSKGQERMPAVVEELGIEYPVARDADQRTAEAWNVMWWPTYGVVDRRGTLRALGLRPDRIDDVLDVLLAEDEPPPIDLSGIELEGDEERRTLLEPLVGNPAPPLRVAQWRNREATTLEGLRGNVVMLDFWATWCGPCLRAIPKTNELHERYADRGLVILGVCHPSGSERMDDVLVDRRIDYPIAIDVDGATASAFRVDSYPDYYFIDRRGRLVIADCANGSVETAIERLLGEAPTEEPEDEPR